MGLTVVSAEKKIVLTNKEGFEAWRALVNKYEPTSKPSVVGKLAEILRTPFDGDLLGALSTSERKIMIYEAQSPETISDFLKIGCVIGGMGQSSMREHLLLSSTICDNWTNFVRVIEPIEHAKKAISAPTPTELDAFQRNCHKCGKYGHTAKVCRNSSNGGAEKPQCAPCGKNGQCWTRSYTSSQKDSQKGGWKGDRTGNGKETQKGGKSKGGKGGNEGKGRGKRKKGHCLNEITEPPEEQWTGGSWEQRSNQSWNAEADTASWQKDDWYTADSNSQASAAAEEFQDASFGELRLSSFGFAKHTESFQLDRLDPSQRTITFGIDTTACKTVVPANHAATRGYLIHKDSLLGCAYSTAGRDKVYDQGKRIPCTLDGTGKPMVIESRKVYLLPTTVDGGH